MIWPEWPEQTPPLSLLADSWVMLWAVEEEDDEAGLLPTGRL